MRQALDLMVDKEALMQGALWGQGAGHRLAELSDVAAPTTRDLKPRPQDFEAAKALLAEAGYGPGKLDFVFKVTTNYP